MSAKVVATVERMSTKEYNVMLHTLWPTKSLLQQWREQDRNPGYLERLCF